MKPGCGRPMRLRVLLLDQRGWTGRRGPGSGVGMSKKATLAVHQINAGLIRVAGGVLTCRSPLVSRLGVPSLFRQAAEGPANRPMHSVGVPLLACRRANYSSDTRPTKHRRRESGVTGARCWERGAVRRSRPSGIGSNK